MGKMEKNKKLSPSTLNTDQNKLARERFDFYTSFPSKEKKKNKSDDWRLRFSELPNKAIKIQSPELEKI